VDLVTVGEHAVHHISVSGGAAAQIRARLRGHGGDAEVHGALDEHLQINNTTNTRTGEQTGYDFYGLEERERGKSQGQRSPGLRYPP